LRKKYFTTHLWQDKTKYLLGTEKQKSNAVATFWARLKLMGKQKATHWHDFVRAFSFSDNQS